MKPLCPAGGEVAPRAGVSFGRACVIPLATKKRWDRGMGKALRRGVAGSVLGVAAALALSGALAQDSRGTVVDGQAMRNADAPAQVGDWLSYSRTWDEQRFSPLSQINDGNVQTLGLAWYADLETYRGVQASPLVIDGVLYNESIFNV